MSKTQTEADRIADAIVTVPHIPSAAHKAAQRYARSIHASKHTADAIEKSLNATDVVFKDQDNFTIAVVKHSSGSITVGTAKRNPNDVPNPLTGRSIALHRALTDLAQIVFQGNNSKGF